MSFYSSIQPWYDEIFPFSEVQRDFVLSFGSNKHLSVVDAGCGTGSLIISLAQVFQTTAGLEPDEAMLEAARNKATFQKAGTWFSNAGMLDLDSHFSPKSVDRLICFGNTLPHLADEKEVAEFARQAALILKPGSRFLVQIINYDRILDQGIGGLPTIENENCTFERFYHYTANPVLIQFQTRLILKATGVVIENEVPLLAIRRARLRQILEDSGFSGIEEFGGFNREPFTIHSPSYIVKAIVSGMLQQYYSEYYGKT